MALISMTGFGRADGVCGEIAWAWEARSVNGKGLDVRVRTPPGLDQMDARAREEAAARFKRGSLQLNLQVKKEAGAQAAPVRINHELVQRLRRAVHKRHERGQQRLWERHRRAPAAARARRRGAVSARICPGLCSWTFPGRTAWPG